MRAAAVGGASLLLILLIASFNVPVSASSQAQSPSCDSQVNQQTASISSGLNNSRAITLALQSPSLQKAAAGQDYKFISIFNLWSFNTSCEVTGWKSVNVVFATSSRNIVVSENPQLTSVLNVTVQGGLVKNTAPVSSCCWAGYDIYEDQSGGGQYPIYESLGDWNVADVSQPSSGFCSSVCAFSVWVELSPQPFNTTLYYVQAGTKSNVTCSSYCSYQYEGWYEFSNTNEIDCLGVYAGDSVSASVYNGVGNGKGSSYYSMSIDDNTIGYSCSAQTSSYNHGTPYYAQFMGERPTLNLSPLPLPQFTTTTMYGYISYNSNPYSIIYGPYSNNYYQKWYMVNAGSQNTCSGQPLGSNICVSSVSSSGSFTLTWKTSSGT